MLLNKTLVSCLVVAVLMSLLGCGQTAKFVYPADARSLVSYAEGPVSPKKVAVTPFDDLRGAKNQSGTYMLYMIPVMPCGWGTYERPDAARMFNTIGEFEFTPDEDLAKAAAFSLRKSNVFADAFFTFGGEKANADLLLEGEILSTKYRGQMWSYGVSVFCPYLWLVGLPAGTSYNDLELRLALKDMATGKVLWTKTYEKTSSVVQGLYYNSGHDAKGYAELMQEVMNDAVKEIAVKVRQ